ncbi:MAG: hypothetical protein OXI43_04355 [Candidatus Poribacteria bacterium]|nr:hypothetical protein [Candidatus Poribacteria bacterium]
MRSDKIALADEVGFCIADYLLNYSNRISNKSEITEFMTEFERKGFIEFSTPIISKSRGRDFGIEQSIDKTIQKLIKDNQIKRVKRGVYRLVQSGWIFQLLHRKIS